MVTLPQSLRSLYPFTPYGFTTPHGAEMSYLDEGPRTDDAVLMLHGNPTWSFYYRNLVQALRPTLRCVVPDHVGMGLSDKPAQYPYTLAARVDDIEALVRRLGLNRIHLVVHDWGGAIGFGLANRLAERIGRLVVLNTAAFPVNRIPARIALCKLPGPGTWAVRGLNAFAGPATWMAMHRRRLTAMEKNGYLFPYGSWETRVAVDAFVKDIPMSANHPTWNALKASEVGLTRVSDRPALVMWGGRDFCFNDHFFAEWRSRLPTAETHYLADAGHYVLEDAAETVVPRVAEFLSR